MTCPPTDFDGAWMATLPLPPVRPSYLRAFTLIELLVVITIIAILAGLVLSTAGYVQKKGARSRAEAEVAALSAALESYKLEYGMYPTGTNNAPGTTNAFLRSALAGRITTNNPSGKLFFEFSKGMGTNTTDPFAVDQAVVDPFGNGYGYQYPGDPALSGTNFFDLWSTCGGDTNIWVKNW